MARPKKQLHRRVDVLKAAQILFEEKGFEKVTIDEIAQNAGISKGSVYLEFKNKDDILISLVETHVIAYFDRVEAKMHEFKPPYLDFIRNLYINRVGEAFDCTVARERSYVEIMNTNYKIKTALRYLEKRGLNIIAYILKKAAENGEIDRYDSYFDLAHALNLCFDGFFPPYDLKYSLEHNGSELNKIELRALLMNDLSMVLDMLLYGLTTRKNETIKQV